jgi:tyrosine aminotransferase
MYVLLKMNGDAFKDANGFFTDVTFAKRLLAEESVLVLPGTCFHAPGYLRLVITVPDDELQNAWDRIETFCERYSVERALTDSPNELDALSNLHISELKTNIKFVDSDEDLLKARSR